jgi:hypothetical protein
MNTSDWAVTEFEGVELGDKRLDERLTKIAGQFMASAESPINKACGNWSETKAAYRFFQNDNVDYKDIIKHHSTATRNRAKTEDVILAIQDTTYFNYSSHKKTEGLGLLSRFTGKYKKDILTKGLYMHTTMAVSTSGLPLGLLDQKITAREVLPKEKVALKKRTHNIALPIEEKESIRWLDSMRTAVSVFDGQNKKIVTVADREADIYNLFSLAEDLNTHYVIRASQNRKVNKSAVHSDITGEMLWEFMGKQRTKGKIRVEVPKKDNEQKRDAKCNIKFGKISVLPPRNYKGEKSTKPLQVYVIQVVEDKPPKGSCKIEWMLYTNIPVLCYKNAIEKIKWYCLRWRIEVYFKVIKSGFNVERCRLETADRLIRYLAVISIVAWRVFWLTLVPRITGKESVATILSEVEWKILFAKFNPHRKIPRRPPCIEESVKWIAQLGGFLARKGDLHPGITHIWRGLEKLSDLVSGSRLLGNICG